MVDKRLFLYDLAVVAIMKNEGPYVKEWLDYHLLAGVDHFYIYDNDSPDNQKEILQPYIDAGIVTYTFYPGQRRLLEAYNDAVKNFKFQCRYMAFVDGDEFIFPKSKPTITEVVDEILAGKQNVAGLSINWIMFGSNGLETADYSRGVLDRFTRRNSGVDRQVKAVTNPRKINFLQVAHFAYFFEGFYSINETGGVVQGPFDDSRTADKIQMHHYHCKSREEYFNRIKRGNGDGLNPRNIEFFNNLSASSNELFDDGIIKYRDARRAALIPEGRGIEVLFPRKQVNYFQLVNSLINALFPTQTKGTPLTFYQGQMETFLTCLSLADFLRKKYFEESAAKFFEEASLQALLKTLATGMTLADIMLFIRELPRILLMNYPVVKDIREMMIRMFPQILEYFRNGNRWQEFKELEFIFSMLKTADSLSVRG